MDYKKVARQIYKYTYPKIQLQKTLDLISENFSASDNKLWERTMKYYQKSFGHNWLNYIYKKLDYPELSKLDVIASFKQYYHSFKKDQVKKRLLSI